MRDLWKELSERVRSADPAAAPELTFGFGEAVRRKVEAARHQGPDLLDDWASVLRPAAGLALGAALLALLLQYRLELDSPPDAVAQTEEMIQLVVLND